MLISNMWHDLDLNHECALLYTKSLIRLYHKL